MMHRVVFKSLTNLRLAVGFVVSLLLVGGAVWFLVPASFPVNPTPAPALPGSTASKRGPTPAEPPVLLASFARLAIWLDQPGETQKRLWHFPQETSNIRPGDYTGADSCRPCHPEKHEAWSNHSHRWMNALANPDTIKGDFSGKATISYLGGKGSFETVGEKYLMKLERGPIKRVYEIHQTIGSRFYQYYVGKLIDGPEPPQHHFYHTDHVLPFGYWLTRREWVPVVHIGPEMPDGERPDPFGAPPEKGKHYAEYASSCNHCHTTFALGDLLLRRPQQVTDHLPAPLHLSLKPFLEGSRPDLLPGLADRGAGVKSLPERVADWDAPKYAQSLGISCEACHLGSRQHAESRGKLPPDFLPKGKDVALESDQAPPAGRTTSNLNWACSRCHTGNRPSFAAGMATWNSVEHSDAIKGSCYSQLRCIDCHDPHQGIGKQWTMSPRKEDSICLKCHDSYRDGSKRASHTHHAPGTPGDRCLNCHMPKIHEGLDGLVRTHMIHSPTRKEMIHENQPNACNLCHADKPIDWTLGYLKDWYGKSFEDWRIRLQYEDRGGPVALGWMKSNHPAVRLVGANAALSSGVPQLQWAALEVLNDPQMINRQFAGKALEEILNLRLTDFGYRHYQDPRERHEPLEKLKKGLEARLGHPPKD